MEFAHNLKVDLWESITTFMDRKIEIQISSNHPAADRQSIVTSAIQQTLDNWDRVQSNLLDSLLETYNDGWSDPEEDLPVLNSEQFLGKVLLRTIYVMEEGAISLYFGDSDLFAGHTVEIYWRPDRMFEATIEG